MSRRQILKEFAFILLWQTFVIMAAYLITGSVDGARCQGCTLSDREFLVAGLVVLVLVVVVIDRWLLSIVAVLFSEPRGRSVNLQRLLVDVVAGLFAAAIAVVAELALPVSTRHSQLPPPHTAGSIVSGSALLLALIVALPAVRFWLYVRRYQRVDDALLLLDRLTAIYSQHLENPLIRPDVSFPIDVKELPEATDPLEAPTKSPVRFPPSGAATLSRFPLDITQAALKHHLNANKEQLLITAGPGGGKSTHLYLLGRDLIAQTKSDVEQYLPSLRQRDDVTRFRFPVVLDITSWSELRYPIRGDAFECWLIDAITATYGIRRRFTRTWLCKGQFVLLLDGLDNLPSAHRCRCVEVVNTYLKEHSGQPLVICCRSDEYAQLSDCELMLQRVELQPIDFRRCQRHTATPRQARNYRQPRSARNVALSTPAADRAVKH